MSNEHAHESSVATYVIVALVLGVITYIEFAIVEFEIAWLSDLWTLYWLVLLSVVKFALVIMFFMHLKDDDKLYTGFFGSGLIFALGTFVALAFLFTLPATFRFLRANSAAVAPAHEAEAEDAHAAEPGISVELRELIASDGYTRPTAAILDNPPPRDMSLLNVLPELPGEADYTLNEAPSLFAQAQDEAALEPTDDPVAEPARDEEEAAEAAADAPGEGEEQTLAEEAAEPEPARPEMAAIAWDEELGDQVYGANCVACHQPTGQGVPGAFPPLAGNMPVLYAAEGGREYLVNVLLYGLQGPIEVAGHTYNGLMPAWAQLSDEQIAAVLNHELTDWGNRDLLESFEPITAEEVAAQRGLDLGMQDVLEQRAELALP